MVTKLGCVAPTWFTRPFTQWLAAYRHECRRPTSTGAHGGSWCSARNLGCSDSRRCWHFHLRTPRTYKAAGRFDPHAPRQYLQQNPERLFLMLPPLLSDRWMMLTHGMAIKITAAEGLSDLINHIRRLIVNGEQPCAPLRSKAGRFQADDQHLLHCSLRRPTSMGRCGLGPWH